ncbi:hypothetical protein [Nesterenkonia ebinurensis]|uniref:hypothetical protein n=1 Tax=Nesterenkonia ebinurensis TaxID=2608252 RepID=UPI00123D0E20|nr:hypothetical protein [Nesterenkonia ebinurensis]
MTEQKNDAAYHFLADPWGQAAAVGVLTLFPVRKYPGWLKTTMAWGPAIGVTAMVATPGATTKVLRKLCEWAGDDPEQINEVEEIKPVTRAGMAVAAGAAMYGGWKLSVWSDTAMENLVRKLRIPAPRVAMGAAAGWATWWQVKQANERVAAQRAERQREAERERIRDTSA